MLFLQPKISNIEVCGLDATGYLVRISSARTKSKLGSSRSDVSKSTIPTLHQRSVELWRFQKRKGIIGPAYIAWRHEWRRESVSSRCVYIRS
jgi:hypothetical protein